MRTTRATYLKNILLNETTNPCIFQLLSQVLPSGKWIGFLHYAVSGILEALLYPDNKFKELIQ